LVVFNLQDSKEISNSQPTILNVQRYYN
jgi:hypothetical protein